MATITGCAEQPCELIQNQVTQILGRFQDGDKKAIDQLYPLVYSELRQIANRYIATGARRPYLAGNRSRKRGVF